jgi:hypothetical protein
MTYCVKRLKENVRKSTDQVINSSCYSFKVAICLFHIKWEAKTALEGCTINESLDKLSEGRGVTRTIIQPNALGKGISTTKLYYINDRYVCEIISLGFVFW